jgi:spore coat polysaccharide biosynthesis predicted glycosyltransferase SpsG
VIANWLASGTFTLFLSFRAKRGISLQFKRQKERFLASLGMTESGIFLKVVEPLLKEGRETHVHFVLE